MAARTTTLRSQADGPPKTSPSISEPEPPGVLSICQLRNELSQMLENKMSDSCDALTLLDMAPSDVLGNRSPGLMSSSSSSVTAQNETDGEDTPAEECGEDRQYFEESQYEGHQFENIQYEEEQYEKEQYEEEQYQEEVQCGEEAQCGEERKQVEELYYVSNEVREYHSLLLQASDALPVDVNACRQHCYHLLASKQVPKAVKCGALYLLAESSSSDGRRQEAKGFLEQALILCDEMDRVNKKQGVIVGMVPHERVQALREQLSTISDAIKCSRVIVLSKHTTPSSSRASSIHIDKRVRLVQSPVTNEDQSRAETDSGSSNMSFLSARQGQCEEEMDGVGGMMMRVDRCHITELEFELVKARGEESKAKRRVHQAKKRRERIEEKLVKTRKLWELQKV